METNNDTKVLQSTIDFALKNGAEQAEILMSKASSQTFKAHGGELSDSKISQPQNIGIRIIKDDRVGISYCESSEETSLQEMTLQALSNSKIVAPSAHEKISADTSIEDAKSNKHNYISSETSMKEKVAFTLSLESEVLKKDSAVKSAPYNQLGEQTSDFYLLNSLGANGHSKSKSYSCYTSALIERNGQQGMHYHSHQAKVFSDLDLDLCVNESYQHANAFLSGSQIKTGTYSVVFTPDAFSDIFSTFFSIFSAKSAMENKNPFKDKLGQAVASSQLTITDDPQYLKAFHHHAFDDEGFISKPLNLITEGVLTNFFHNSATSKYLKTDNTYRASRGPKTSLGVSGTNTVIHTGPQTENDIYANEVLEVATMEGLHSGVNPISGEFSFGAKGYLKKSGETIQTVKGITISGNFFHLIKNIEAMGNEIKSDSSFTFFAPLIRFHSMQIGGL